MHTKQIVLQVYAFQMEAIEQNKHIQKTVVERAFPRKRDGTKAWRSK